MKSSKLDAAVNKVRGIKGQPEGAPENDGGALVKHGETTVGITRFDPRAFAEGIADGAWEMAPQMITLKEGDQIAGTLVECGETEIEDQITHEPKLVKIWVVRYDEGEHKGMRVRLLSAAQLDDKLPPFIGGKVVIARGPDLNIGNGSRRVTQYLVKGQRPPALVRSFVQPPEHEDLT